MHNPNPNYKVLRENSFTTTIPADKSFINFTANEDYTHASLEVS
jgi:hypothetical protein